MIKSWKNVLIVLGCAPNRDNTPSYLMRKRVEKAISLYKKNKYDVVIFTGGPNKTKIPESEMMRGLSFEVIPVNRIITEEKSLSTIQNAIFTWELIKDKDIKKLTVLTSNFHIKRSRYIFKKLYAHMGVSINFIASKDNLRPVARFMRWIHETIETHKLRIHGIK